MHEVVRGRHGLIQFVSVLGGLQVVLKFVHRFRVSIEARIVHSERVESKVASATRRCLAWDERTIVHRGRVSQYHRADGGRPARFLVGRRVFVHVCHLACVVVNRPPHVSIVLLGIASRSCTCTPAARVPPGTLLGTRGVVS